MSLPSRAIVRTKAGEELAQPFVNCGWWVNSVSLARTFFEIALEEEVKKLPLVDTDTVEAYSETLTIGFLRKMKDQEQLQQFFEVKWAAEQVIKEQLDPK